MSMSLHELRNKMDEVFAIMVRHNMIDVKDAYVESPTRRFKYHLKIIYPKAKKERG